MFIFSPSAPKRRSNCYTYSSVLLVALLVVEFWVFFPGCDIPCWCLHCPLAGGERSYREGAGHVDCRRTAGDECAESCNEWLAVEARPCFARRSVERKLGVTGCAVSFLMMIFSVTVWFDSALHGYVACLGNKMPARCVRISFLHLCCADDLFVA